MPTDRQTFLDVAFDVFPADVLISRIAATRPEDRFRYLVTPNVDHMVRLHKIGEQIPGLKDAYRNADFCICDSKIVGMLANWRGVRLPIVPGSDLTAALFDHVIQKGDRIAIIGGNEALLASLRHDHPQVEFVQHLPPMGLLQNPAARAQAAKFIAKSKARFSFICVGSPQQELIAAEAATFETATGMAFCIGAALEFITGQTKRAPKFAQRLGLEWAHRLLTNPRRLWRRYLVEGPVIFLLAYRWPRSAA